MNPMKPVRFLGKLALGTIVTAGIVSAIPTTATAAEFSNGWYYVQDSLNDGSNYWGIGTAHSSNELRFEINSLAVKVEASTMTVAINSHTPLGGIVSASSCGYTVNPSGSNPITFGDLFLNFSGQSFNTAMSSGNLFGVRFDQHNESGVALGVYSNVQAKSVTSTNNGYSSLNQYNQAVSAAGKTVSMGDINSQDNSYFTTSDPIKAVINSGTQLSNTISILSSLSGLGLDSSLFGTPTNEAFAFSFSTTGLPTGDDFLAHLFYECGNDGLGMAINAQDVPEPFGLVSVATLGLIGSSMVLCRRQLA